MPLFGESEQKILGDILFDVVNKTNITRTSPGSKMRSLSEAISEKLGLTYAKFDAGFVQAFVSSAQGDYLDFIGDVLNTPRLGTERATISDTDTNLRFYVEVGTFGSINGASSITVPSGTIVSSEEGGNGVIYRTTVQAILAPGSSSAYVSAEANSQGPEGNVGTSVLRFHGFTDYVDSAENSLKVINDRDIVSGKGSESDTNYRFRIVNKVTTAEAANATALRLAVLSVAGVSNVELLRYARGIGTFDVLIESISPSVSAALIESVKQAVQKVTAHGEVPKVKAPKEVGLSLVATLTLKNSLSTEAQTQLINRVTTNVRTYIDTLGLAQGFIVNEVVERIMSTSTIIKNVGSANDPLDEVYIWRLSSVEDTKNRNVLLGDYTAEKDERVIVESVYAGDTPILIQVA